MIGVRAHRLIFGGFVLLAALGAAAVVALRQIDAGTTFPARPVR